MLNVISRGYTYMGIIEGDSEPARPVREGRAAHLRWPRMTVVLFYFEGIP
jgi:hypothetical protein